MSLKNKNSFKCNRRVRYNEIDSQKIVYISHYSTFFDIAISEFFTEIRFDQDAYVEKTNNDFHVIKATLEFKAPARLNDELEVFTHVKNVGNSSITFEQEIYLKNTNDLLTVGEVIWVNADQKTRASTTVPDSLRESLKKFEN